MHVLRRGDVEQPGPEARPGALSAVRGPAPRFALADPDDEAARRAALARWLTDGRNPLVWRSLANRVWQHHFGRGLVATPNDFGRMGERPTHPELLDWLALRLRGGEQSVVDLHRLILNSATYRQRSDAHRPDHAARDGGNRYLWRMNRRRLDAEALHDALLAAGGELDPSMGGPGFDRFGFEDDHSPRYLYEEHDPGAARSRRRSIYRFVVRSVPDPLFATFDCADPSLSVPARGETTTPLQALALLNDPFALARAEALARRASLEPDPVAALFRFALARGPGPDERAAVARYAGERGLPAAARVVLNTSEFLYVD